MLMDWAAYSFYSTFGSLISPLRSKDRFSSASEMNLFKLCLCLSFGNQIEILIIARLPDIKRIMSDAAEFPVKNSASDKISVKIRYDPAVFPAV